MSEQPNETPKPEALPEVPRRSLGELLHLARVADEAMLEAELDLEELGADLRAKVDGIVSYLDRCRERAAMIKKRADELAAKAKAWSNKADRLEEYVANKMHEDATLRSLPKGETYKLSGLQGTFEFRLRYSERVTIKVQPGPATFLTHKELIDRSYAWKLNDLKKRLKASDDKVTPFAAITNHPWLEIKPKSQESK